MFTENTAVFVADFGVPATWFSAAWAIDATGPSLDSSTFGPSGLVQQTANVLFDQPDTEILSRRVQSRGYKIAFPSSQFVGIKFNDAMTIAGVNYSVLEINDIDDGVFYEAVLQAI
jgi:hypothetical protein